MTTKSGGTFLNLHVEAVEVLPAPMASQAKRLKIWQRVYSAPEQALIDKAKTHQVQDAESYRIAAETVRGLKQLSDTVEGFYEHALKPLRLVGNAIRDWKTTQLDTLKVTREALDARAIAWKQDEERKEREERERAQAEERRKAEAEQLRRAQELQAQAKASNNPDMKRALKTEAQSILATPVTPTAVTVPKRVPTTSGYSTRTYYSAVLDDEAGGLMALVKAVAEGREPLEAVCANQAYANQRATDQKDNFQMPGFKLVKRTGSSTR